MGETCGLTQTHNTAGNVGTIGGTIERPEETKSGGNPRRNDASRSNRRKKNKQVNTNLHPVTKWEGRCDKIKTQVFYVAGIDQADQCTRAVKEIMEYVEQ